MKIAKNYRKDIFCLEGDWHKDLRDKSSILASLMFLQQNIGIKYIYKQCGTKENLQFYLNHWKQKKYKAYSICYIAFHGHPEGIQVGKDFVSLDELAEMLEGSCKDKIIHFGSCNTLQTNKHNLNRFLKKTEALCVCGFRTDIDFVQGSAFDMILLQMFQNYRDITKVDRDINLLYKGFVRSLDFKLVYLE